MTRTETGCIIVVSRKATVALIDAMPLHSTFDISSSNGARLAVKRNVRGWQRVCVYIAPLRGEPVLGPGVILQPPVTSA